MHNKNLKKYFFINKFDYSHFIDLDENITFIWRNKDKEVNLDSISKLKNYASKLCSFGATLIGKGAEIESRFKGKGLDFCIKTFGDEPTWEMLQKFRNWDEFENFLEQA